jgi:hypothetical protein
MAKYIEGLGVTMKDRKSFETLPEEVKLFVYGFLSANRKIRSIQKELAKQKAKYEEIIAPLQKELKKQKDKESENYLNIKELPEKLYTIARLYVEKDKYSYMVVVSWCGERRKFSIGGDLKEIERKLKIMNKGDVFKLTATNFKSIIPHRIKYHLNDFFLKNSVANYLEGVPIKWNSKGKFAYQKEIVKPNEDLMTKKVKSKVSKSAVKRHNIGGSRGFSTD